MNVIHNCIILIVLKLIHVKKKFINDISSVKDILMKLEKAYACKESNPHPQAS